MIPKTKFTSLVIYVSQLPLLDLYASKDHNPRPLKPSFKTEALVAIVASQPRRVIMIVSHQGFSNH